MRIDCQNITYSYPGTSKIILNNISLILDRPGFHALFGPSGVGKTSFARILADLVDEFEGQVRHSGKTVLYTYNLERLPGWSSVEDHLKKVTPHGKDSIREELLLEFGLEESVGMPFFKLSLGQKNRVNLIRYLLQDFDVLIMDESLANVDESTRETIILKMKHMFPTQILLYISHNVVEVAKFCEQVVVFRTAGKQPQIKIAHGCNHATQAMLSEEAINTSLLEIMHAS